jgi:hypothetical protein
MEVYRLYECMYMTHQRHLVLRHLVHTFGHGVLRPSAPPITLQVQFQRISAVHLPMRSTWPFLKEANPGNVGRVVDLKG